MHLEVEWDRTSELQPGVSAAPLVCTRRVADIPAGDMSIHAECIVPLRPRGVVLVATTGPEIGRESRESAEFLRHQTIATVLFTLCGTDEGLDESCATQVVNRLAGRMVEATRWAAREPEFASVGIGYLVSGWAVPAALKATTMLPPVVDAVVCDCGRFDLSRDFLGDVETPVSLIAGERDTLALARSREAYYHLHSDKELVIIKNAGTDLREPAAVQSASEVATQWFGAYLRGR